MRLTKMFMAGAETQKTVKSTEGTCDFKSSRNSSSKGEIQGRYRRDGRSYLLAMRACRSDDPGFKS